MSTEQFYMVLPSNSSLNYFPANTLTSYTTKLAQPLNLEGQWEVGLSEIQFQKSWFNVRKDGHWVYYKAGTGDLFLVDEVPIGFYATVQDLIEPIHQAIQRIAPQALQNTKLIHDKISNRVQIEIRNGASILFADDIATILGFQSPLVDAPNSPNLQLGIYSLYIYTDLVEAQTVGDTRVPLLRIVPAQGAHGEFITKTYERPQYIPIEKSLVDTIQIDIRDDTGQRVHFQSGKVVVTVHLRLAISPKFT